jgi:hypothetical protein
VEGKRKCKYLRNMFFYHIIFHYLWNLTKISLSESPLLRGDKGVCKIINLNFKPLRSQNAIYDFWKEFGKKQILLFKLSDSSYFRTD